MYGLKNILTAAPVYLGVTLPVSPSAPLDHMPVKLTSVFKTISWQLLSHQNKCNSVHNTYRGGLITNDSKTFGFFSDKKWHVF